MATRSNSSLTRLSIGTSLFLFLGGCAPKMDPAEVASLLMPSGRGLFANVEVGDSWSDVKSKHDNRLKVVDNNIGGDPMRQLRYDLGRKIGTNCFYLTFQLASDRVQEYQVRVSGEKQNQVAVGDVKRRIRSNLDAKLGPGMCRDSAKNESCDWSSKTGAIVAKLHYGKPDAEGYSWVQVDVLPAPGPASKP